MAEFSLQPPQLEYLMTAGRLLGDVEGQDGANGSGLLEALPQPTRLAMVEGESLTNVVSPISYALARRRGGGGEFDGALHITNFRLALERTGPGKAAFGSSDPSLEWVSFPMGCIKAVTQASEDPLAITITAKDMRSCRMRFSSSNALFVTSLTQIIGSMAGFSQTSPEKAFAITHAAAVQRKQAACQNESLIEAGEAQEVTGNGKPEMDGWLVYDEEAEFVRQGVIRPTSLDSDDDTDETSEDEHSTVFSTKAITREVTRWRLFHNRSHRVVPTYPLHFVVPAAMSDADIRSVAAYRCKGRLPVVTWMDPETKAVLSRSAQPLAGLGGKSCPQDENLLGFFRRKGLNVIPTPVPETAVAEPSAKGDRKNDHAGVGGGKDSGRPDSRRGVPSVHDTSRGPSIKSPKRRTISAAKGDKPRGERNPSGGSDNGDLGESLMGLVGLSSWTPPWSMTRVNIQQGEEGDKLEQKPPDKHAQPETKPDTADPRSNIKRREEKDRDRSKSQAETKTEAGAMAAKRSTGVPTTASEGFKLGGSEVAGDGEEPQLCVLDARTAAAAMGNQLVGKGVERGAGYGSSIQLVFSGIGNVNAVRDAFEEMRNALDPVKPETESRSIIDKTSRSLGFSRGLDLNEVLGEELEEGKSFTQWPRLLRQILAAGVLAARMLRLKGCSVLVHCSDGWDRTPQICSIVGLLLDPYYRTVEGFCVLIEKEWLSFGHKFWARCMGGSNENAQDRENLGGLMGMAVPMSNTVDFSGGTVKDYEELSPVFIQFLDLAHNLMNQFPTAFEFTEDLLTFVAEHTFSGLFGTFLCDTERRRRRLKLKDRTVSIWTAVLNKKAFFKNEDFVDTKDVLWPSLASSKIRTWERQYWRVPSLRPNDVFTNHVWEDHILVTARLLGGPAGVDHQEEGEEEDHVSGE